jgi:hypothetical protein
MVLLDTRMTEEGAPNRQRLGEGAASNQADEKNPRP